MSKTKRLPPRSKVKTDDTWDLSSLYPSDEAWEKDFARWRKQIKGYEKHRGQLAGSAAALCACLEFDLDFERLGERLGYYASLKTTEDQTNSDCQAMMGRYQSVAAQAAQAASYIRPELMAIADARLKKLLQDECLAPYRLYVEQIVRFKPHTLSQREEELLAMQSEMASAVGKSFSQLLNSDLKFGFVENEHGDNVELSNSTFMQLLNSPQRGVRKTAFHQYYAQIEGHENTLAAMLAGSIHKDVYYARARGYASARDVSLYADDVPAKVYDNLIKTVHKHLPAVHRYFDLRKRKMKLRDIHHYDTYVPIITDFDAKRSWKDAVKLVVESLAPLGSEYCGVLEKGLLGRWCDRYPNHGKQSGAFSAGSFDGDPYILMNYQPTVLNDVFTLTHEAGHSMHSYYSKTHQPFQYYGYAIFVAEVASTFNEELLAHHMMARAQSDKERAYLINRVLDDVRSTIVRQTMFAEFEKITHEMAEAGEALTVASLKAVYGQLLAQYFGPDFALDDQLSLECFRIPHFYRAFYVYKYATGMSAAIALSQRVLTGGEGELADYLNFLKGGCSKFPL
ncbi:MAG: oligoendopeptidase F, partial [Planctomycetales bacterium]|nr:oligoendopeptidase F [Planctomycetales bacterium]